MTYTTLLKNVKKQQLRTAATNTFREVDVTAALRVTLRDMTETYVAVAWDREVPDDHAS